MGTEYRDGPVRNLLDLVDETHALRLQILHDAPVMDDFVAYVNRRAVLMQGPFDDFDGAVDAGAKTARLCQDDLHRTSPERPHGGAILITGNDLTRLTDVKGGRSDRCIARF